MIEKVVWAISSFSAKGGQGPSAGILKFSIRILLGPLAHLVERFHGMEEVTGSIPVWSTIISFLDN